MTGLTDQQADGRTLVRTNGQSIAIITILLIWVRLPHCPIPAGDWHRRPSMLYQSMPPNRSNHDPPQPKKDACRKAKESQHHCQQSRTYSTHSSGSYLAIRERETRGKKGCIKLRELGSVITLNPSGFDRRCRRLTLSCHWIRQADSHDLARGTGLQSLDSDKTSSPPSLRQKSIS